MFNHKDLETELFEEEFKKREFGGPTKHINEKGEIIVKSGGFEYKKCSWEKAKLEVEKVRRQMEEEKRKFYRR